MSFLLIFFNVKPKGQNSWQICGTDVLRIKLTLLKCDTLGIKASPTPYKNRKNDPLVMGKNFIKKIDF